MPSNLDTALGNLTGAGFNSNIASSFLGSASQDFLNIASNDFGQIQSILDQGITGGLSQVNEMLFPQGAVPQPNLTPPPQQPAPVAQPVAPAPVAQPGLNFVPGLDQNQIAGITNLVQNKPIDQWSQTDFDNYNYATGGNLQRPSGVNVPDSFGADALGGGGDFSTVDFDSAATDILSGVDLTIQNIRDFINSQSEEQVELGKERTGFQDKLIAQIDKLSGRTKRTQELEEQIGLTDQIKTLNDLSSQLAQAKADYDNLIAAEGSRNIPKAFVTGRQNQIRQRAAVELGGLAAMAEAAAGNITASEALIDKSIEREFQPILDEINLLRQQLEINRDQLSAADKKRADELNLILDERERKINEDAQAKSDIMKIAADAASNRASASTIRAIMNAGSPEEALELSTAAGGTFKPSTGGTTTTKITDASRQEDLNQFLIDNNLFGEDGLVSWETYLAMRQTWINNGGSDAKFTILYPIGSSLDADNQSALKKILKGE